MPKRKELVYWNIPVPKPLDRAVEEAIRQNMHISKSDLVRDAVRRLLRGMESQRKQRRRRPSLE